MWVHGSIILNWISKKKDEALGCIHAIRIGTRHGLCEYGNEPSAYNITTFVVNTAEDFSPFYTNSVIYFISNNLKYF
jgi:hypothetical protein